MQGSQTNLISAPGSAGRLPLAGRRLGGPTPGQGPGLKITSDLRSPASGLTLICCSRRAFTLTELLVVIAIIGVLASLITAAAVNALRNAKRARIVLEIKQMATAAENFKNDVGAYPPNGMFDGSTAEASMPQRVNDFQTMGRKLSSRINQGDMNVLIALAGGNPPSSPSGNVTTGPLDGGMTAAEAVYFWLGGFSQDPQFPISGPGGPSFKWDDPANDSEVLEDRIRRYEFNLGQLGPRNEDGLFHDDSLGGTGRFIEYNIDMNGNGTTTDPGEERRINLWRYQPSGSEQPFVYFDCSRNKPYQYDVSAAPSVPIFPFKALRQGITAANLPRDIIFQESPKFQILHCGLDDAWGDFTLMRVLPTFTTPNDLEKVLRFPEGPFTGDLADTLTNFTDGEIADEAEE
jgi:prepilin-type N-terminal cleavage/methylation domain-containing protein